MKKGSSLTLKLISVGLAFTVPIAALLAFLVNEKTKSIRVAQHEIAGLEILRPLNQLLLQVGQHQVYSMAKNMSLEDESIANNLVSLNNSISQSIREIDSFYQSDSFQKFLADIEDSGMKRPETPATYLKSAWEDTLRQVQTDGRSTTAHKISLQAIQRAIVEFSNVSELVLDPDLDSYHTISVLVTSVPASQAAYLSTVTYALNSLTTKEANSSSIVRASAQKSLVGYHLESAEGGISEAIKSDSNFYGRNESLNSEVPDHLKRYQESLDASFRELFPERGANAPASMPNLSFLLAPLEKSADFSKSLIKTAEQLLQTRIQSTGADRTQAVIYVVVCWLGASLLGYFLQRSVVTPIRKILQELNDISTDTRHTSTKLHASAQRSAAAATEEATAIQETVAAMEEMTSMLAQTAIHTRNASEVAQDVLEKTRSGTQTMENMARSMDTIANANTRLNEITKIIEDITSKTNVINDIVFKTQLLAVNASIEAARAGHHGKGFAVVANEVANLANMSGKAATDIRHLLNESRLQVSHILDSTADSVRNGQTVCNEALETFDTISKAITSISEKVDQINEATREQETGVKQTSTAMTNINQATISNNEASQDNAIMAERLKTQANRLIRIGRAMNFVVLGTEQTVNRAKAESQSSLDLILGESADRAALDDEDTGASLQETADQDSSDAPNSKHDLARRVIKKVRKDADDYKKSA